MADNKAGKQPAPMTLDLTKEQRDKHIRRYAELLEMRTEISRQIDAKIKTPENPKGARRPQGIASLVAEETGMNVRMVQRALNAKPLVNGIGLERIQYDLAR